jgi:hypothetical protein
MARTEDETPFGEALLEGRREAAAGKRCGIALPVRNASHTANCVKATRKSVAKTSREFSRRFGIPVRKAGSKAAASPIRQRACYSG